MSTVCDSILTRARFERRGVSVTHLSMSSSFVAVFDGPGAHSKSVTEALKLLFRATSRVGEELADLLETGMGVEW